MASALKFNLHFKPSTPLSISPTHTHLLLFQTSPSHKLTLTCSLSPPTTREEAVSQAKLSLSTTLKKPLNNPTPFPTRKLKKLCQHRNRVEIPVIDDSPNSITQLAFEMFHNLPITRKGTKPSMLILWPNPTMVELAHQAFIQASSVTNSELGSVRDESLNSADLVVFMGSEASQVGDIKEVSNSLYPKPVVLFNPKWGTDEEKDFELASFVGSFCWSK